jgi:hypothetical protein
MTQLRMTLLGALFLFSLAACGGGDKSGGSPGDAGGTTQPASDGGPEGGSEGGRSPGRDSGSAPELDSGSGSGLDSGSGAEPDSGSRSEGGTATVSGLHAVMGSSGHPGRIVDASGKVVILHGVNESGSENYCFTWGPPAIVLSPAGGPSPLTQDSLTAMKQWGINTVRIPLNEDCWLGINGVDSSVGGANYQSPIADAVNLITKTNSMYVILDLHVSAPGTTKAVSQGTMPDVDHSVTFWQQVAAAYKDNGSVIFDLFNEPNLGSAATEAQQYQCWKMGSTSASSGDCTMMSFAVAGMQTLLTAVRQTGATNLILLGGTGDASYLDLWPQYVPTDTLSPPNLAASWHVYDDQGGCTSNPAQTLSTLCPATLPGLGAEAVMEAGYPIVVGETGYYSCSGSVGQDWWPVFLSWADAQEIGTVAWAWSDGSNPQLLKETTNFTPNANGQVYKTFLGCISGASVTPLTSCTSLPASTCE